MLEAGALETAADWDLVMQDLAPGGRVCAYSRAGLGASPSRSRTPDVPAIISDLARTLDSLGERRPVILVGHSNGALYAEGFARRWPDRVAGLIYVDGVNSTALDNPTIVAALHQERRGVELAYLIGRVGASGTLARVLTDRIGLRGAAAERKARALTSLNHRRASRDEERLVIQGLRTVRRLPALPSRIPIAVLIAAENPQTPLAQSWRSVQLQSAASAKAQWILDMPGATHVSPLGRDRAYVAAAVAWIRRIRRQDMPSGIAEVGRGMAAPELGTTAADNR